MAELKRAPDSFDQLAASIERVLRTDLAPPGTASNLAGTIDRLMHEEACAAELRIAYLRVLVIAPYAVLGAWTFARAAPTDDTVLLGLPAALTLAWLAAAGALTFGLRRGAFRHWMPHVVPYADALMMTAAFLATWRARPVALAAVTAPIAYTTSLCAFLSLSGGLRLSRGAARSAAVLGVLVFVAAAATARMDTAAALGIGTALVATGLLSGSVTTLIRRLVTDGVARSTLASMYKDAEAAIDAREQVLKIVSHDLRNPLHTISMCASVLLDVPMPAEKQAEHLHRVKRAGERMNRLVQDLLDVAKLEAGRVAISARPVAVAPLVRESHEMLAPLAAEKGVTLDIVVADGLQQIVADEGRVLQVLSNLVGNAVKFTPAGGRIVIRAEDAPGGVRFSVSDTGQGMSPDQLSQIFGQFWQANPADRRGIGLGLSIAKGIVEAHGGRIWAESQPGRGTTFHFTLSSSLSSAATATASGSRDRRRSGEVAPAGG